MSGMESQNPPPHTTNNQASERQDVPFASLTVSRSSHVKTSSGAYLRVTINKQKLWGLLDSGGELSIVPASAVRPEQIRPSTQTLQVANGTMMEVLGEATLPVVIEGIPGYLNCLVAANVELILGMDWMENNITNMNYKEQTLTIDGQTIQYHRPKKPERVQIGRASCRERV